MNYLLKKLMRQGGYMDQAGDGTDGGAGGGVSDDNAAQAAADAAKTAADAAAKAVADKAKPTISDEEARLLKENMKRKVDLQKASDELTALKKQFEGIDPEVVKKLMAEQKSAEEKQLEAKGDYERLKQRMAEEHTRDTQVLKDQISALQGDLTKSNGAVNELSVGTQFGNSKFITEEMTMTPSKARVVYANHFDLEEGKLVGYDKPRGESNRTALVDQYGNAVGFDDAMRKIVEADPEKDYLIKSKVKPGAGSDSRKPTTPVNKQTTDTISSVSKISSGLKNLKQS
jgi:hypothetical protein